MSSTNPRRAAFRPNGAASHQQPHHQQHSYTSKPSTPQPSASKESDELRALRSRFGSKLDTLKELFSNWSDEDLLNVLSESSGSVETAVSRIAEGHAEQWGAVSRKKDKKGTTHSGAGSPHQQQQHFAARDRAESGGAASPGRGSGFRGRGGGRGGRGGGFAGRSGGRGGHHGVNGHGPAGSPPPSGTEIQSTSTFDPATDGVPAAVGSSSTDPAGVMKKPSDVPNGVHEHPVAQPPPSEQDNKLVEKPAVPKTNGTAAPIAKPAVKASPVPAKMSWAQIAKPKPKPAAPSVQHSPTPAAVAPVLPAAPEPTPAQAEEPAAVPPEEPTTVENLSWEEEKSSAPTAPVEPAEAPLSAWPEPTTTAPGDDWITVTPPPKPSVELPVVPATTSIDVPIVTPSKTWTEITAPSAPVCSINPANDFPGACAEGDQPEVPSTNQASTTATESAPAPPPGLPSLPSVSTPALAAPSAIPRSSTPSTKPATPRLSSHRASARFRSDVPVVLPAGIGAVGSGIGSLSFGSAVIGTGFDTPTRGMQFGSLSLNDDFESTLSTEAPAPEPVKEEEPAPAPAPIPVPAPPSPLEPISKPEPSPVPVAAPIPEVRAPTPPPPQTLSQTSSTLSSNGLGSMGLYQQQQQQHASQLQPLPQQVTSAQSAIPSQVQTSTAPSTLPFVSHQGPAPGLQLPQQQAHQPQTVSHSHQAPQQQHVSPGQSTNNIHTPSQHQAQTQATQQTAPQHLPYSTNHQLPPHLDASVTSQQQTHPSVAAQNQYFRQESSYFHSATPPQSIIPQQHQLSQSQDHSLSHSSPYGAFSPLAQTQASHLTGFGGSPAPADYGSYGDSQRGFYDSYGQASAFPNRTQLGHEDTTKTGLPGTAPTTTALGQQTSALGQGQPALSAAQQAQQQQQFPGMMPYYYSQPYYMPNQYYPQSNPYPPQPPYVKYPSYQPPHGPGAPPLQQQAGKPPASTNTPYSSQQAHSYHPGQTGAYEDPTTVAYQQNSNPTADYGKQAPLYGQGIQNFFGAQTPVQSAGAPQLGSTAQQRGATGASTSPENPYKTYTGPAGVTDKQGQQQTGQGRGTVPGGPQPQGGYYNNRYSTAPQPPAQGYPQSDGQFYPSYQHQQPRQGYWQ